VTVTGIVIDLALCALGVLVPQVWPNVLPKRFGYSATIILLVVLGCSVLVEITGMRLSAGPLAMFTLGTVFLVAGVIWHMRTPKPPAPATSAQTPAPPPKKESAAYRFADSDRVSVYGNLSQGYDTVLDVKASKDVTAHHNISYAPGTGPAPAQPKDESGTEKK
jgi:predicted membrane channel-forming protein YqfA (hemolysin III family)